MQPLFILAPGRSALPAALRTVALGLGGCCAGGAAWAQMQAADIPPGASVAAPLWAMLLLPTAFALAGLALILYGTVRRQRRALQATQGMVRLQTAVLDAIPMPVYLRGRDLKLIACNGVYARACGRPREALRNASVEDCMLAVGLQPAAAESLKQDYYQVIDSRLPLIRDRDTCFRSGRITLQHWMAPMLDASGDVVGIVGGWLDISERQKTLMELAEARDRAEAANRAKSTFLASISHDIRTPMNAIMGMLELTLLQATLPRAQQQQLQTALESAQSLLSLIGDLLDLSRMEAGKFQLRPCPAALRDVVQEVAGVFAPVAAGNGIALDTRVGAEVCPRHRADPLRLKQILNNLVSNAIRFTRRGRVCIQLCAFPPESGYQWVEFRVIDTGLGIPQNALPTLLDPFVQAHPELSHRGTGLGLSICKRLVDKMGGTIRIDSEVGRGTCVVIRLPLPVAPPAAAADGGQAALRPHELPPWHAGIPILVVDDQPSSRLLLRRQLEKLGHTVVCVEDGARALAAVDEQAFKLVICDCAMPQMGGHEFVRRLRGRLGSNALVPVLAYTASAHENDVRQALAAGMNAVLVKPVSINELRAALDAHLPAAPPPAPQAPTPTAP